MLLTNLPTPRSQRRADSRRRLLEAAGEVFSETGFAAARASDIARRARVAVGTLYLHFQDKDGIALAVALEALGELRRRLRAATAGPGLTEEGTAHAHAAALVDFVIESGRTARLLFAPDAAGLREEVFEVLAEAQEARLIEGGREGLFRTDIDTAVAAQALVGLQWRVLTWWLQHPDRASRDAVVDTLAKLRLSGIHRGFAGAETKPGGDRRSSSRRRTAP